MRCVPGVSKAFSGLIAALLVAGCPVNGCYRTPQEGFNTFLAQFDHSGEHSLEEVTPGDLDIPVEATGCNSEGSVRIGGSFVLVFVTDLKTEPSADVLLVLTQCGNVADGTAVVSGRAVSVELPDMQLGTVPDATVKEDGSVELVVEGFLIPPGQEALLPDGGTAEIRLETLLEDSDVFCGVIDFHLLSPIDLHQAGTFGAYRLGVVDPGNPGCEE